MSRTLALAILAALGAWTSSPSQTSAAAQGSPQPYTFCAECYDWENTFDPPRARSWAAQRIRVKLVGDLADQNSPALLAALNRLQKITGIEFEQVDQQVQLLVIDDTRAYESVINGLPHFQVTAKPTAPERQR